MPSSPTRRASATCHHRNLSTDNLQQETGEGSAPRISWLAITFLLFLGPPALAQQHHSIPLVTPASNLAQQGFVRIINHSDRGGTVSIHAIDDTGRRFGPATLSLDAKEAVQFNSRDLEEGNPDRGLSGGVGDGTDNWRLELSTDLNIEPLAYIRTPDGFLTSMHDLVPEANGCHHVPIFNPGSNRSLESLLRLINPGEDDAYVYIRGLDARGDASPYGYFQLDLPAGAARTLSARQLEQGIWSGTTDGRLGDGEGKWHLLVSAESASAHPHPIQVMSLIRTRSGHLANLSTSPSQTFPPAGCGETGASGDDHGNTIPEATGTGVLGSRGDGMWELETSLSGTIEQGNDVDYFRIYVAQYGTLTVYTTGTLDTVGTLRNEGGSVLSTDGGSGSGTNFRMEHSSLHPGDYYIQVESHESNTGDYTLHATFEPRYGAMAYAFGPMNSCRGVVWGWGVSSDQDRAESQALDQCRRRGGGGVECDLIIGAYAASNCGAMAIGDVSSSRCGLCGGHGTTRTDAEEHALATCRDRGYSNCRIVSDGPNRASACGFGS